MGDKLQYFVSNTKELQTQLEQVKDEVKSLRIQHRSDQEIINHLDSEYNYYKQKLDEKEEEINNLRFALQKEKVSNEAKTRKDKEINEASSREWYEEIRKEQ